MATKYFCDGCDKEIKRFGDNGGQQMKVLLEDEGKDTTLTSGSFHLCQACARRMCECADPRRWPRAPRVSAA